MCLLALDWQPGSATPLRLIGNRDEFHARPARALHRWACPGAAHVSLLGGRDEQAGGSWLAASDRGTVAALTNVRDPHFAPPAGAPSRGELVCLALASDDPCAFLTELAAEAPRYAGFNLLVATPERLWHLHHGRRGTRLARLGAGVYGVSNANLDTPWPKVTSACRAMEQTRRASFPGPALAALQDTHSAADTALPDTGVGLELERLLSAAFIIGEQYGTRATTWLTLGGDGHITMTEQSFGPAGRLAGTRHEGIGPGAQSLGGRR